MCWALNNHFDLFPFGHSARCFSFLNFWRAGGGYLNRSANDQYITHISTETETEGESSSNNKRKAADDKENDKNKQKRFDKDPE